MHTKLLAGSLAVCLVAGCGGEAMTPTLHARTIAIQRTLAAYGATGPVEHGTTPQVLRVTVTNQARQVIVVTACTGGTHMNFALGGVYTQGGFKQPCTSSDVQTISGDFRFRPPHTGIETVDLAPAPGMQWWAAAVATQ